MLRVAGILRFEKITVVNSQSEFGMSSRVSLERGKGGLFQRLSRAIGALLLRTVPLEHTTLQGCGGDPPLRLIARSDVLHFRAVRLHSDARTGAQSGEKRVARSVEVA